MTGIIYAGRWKAIRQAEKRNTNNCDWQLIMK